jgi:DNA-binding transcriptional LysR family regulator
MNLQNLRYFLVLCDEQNFVQAAKRRGISQPSITNAFKRLERQIGGALFLRKPKTQPTALALTIKPYFEQVFRDSAV